MRLIYIFLIISLTAVAAIGQNFDFERINKKAFDYTVAVNIKLEVSFGTQTSDAQIRGIGTIVTRDGLVIFDGSPLDDDSPFSMMSGMQMDIKPTSIEIVKSDGTRYPADYIGVDRFTKLGFCRITSETPLEFKPVSFSHRRDYRVGEWLAAYLLLPEFVSPLLASDVGMISALIQVPDQFVFTVGFNEMELGSVLYDSAGYPIGVLGLLDQSAFRGMDISTLPSFAGEETVPLLGVIPAEKIEKLVKDPPTKGKVDRGWLGIYLQALTVDIADFWGIDTKSGIIVNEVVKDSPADSAGLQTGDIIVRLNGNPITVDKEENLPIFQKQISDLGANSRASFEVLRRTNGTVDTVQTVAVLSPAPITPAEAPSYEDTNFEFTLRDLVFADYNIFNLDRKEFKGVMVKEVESGGWASVADIMPGFIIQSIDGEKVTSVEDAKKILNRIAEKKPKEVVFFIWRDNKTVFINVKTDW